MEARVTRCQVIEAEEKVLQDGRIKKIRHRAIIKEECTEGGEPLVYVCELVKADNGWKGENKWRLDFQSFEDTAGHYRYLSEKPNGWWDGKEEATFPTCHAARSWRDEHGIEGEPVLHRAYEDGQGGRLEVWAILTQEGYAWRGRTGW